MSPVHGDAACEVKIAYIVIALLISAAPSQPVSFFALSPPHFHPPSLLPRLVYKRRPQSLPRESQNTMPFPCAPLDGCTICIADRGANLVSSIHATRRNIRRDARGNSHTALTLIVGRNLCRRPQSGDALFVTRVRRVLQLIPLHFRNSFHSAATLGKMVA